MEGDVERAEVDLDAAELLDQPAEALRERDAARVDADERDRVEVGVRLDDLVGDAVKGALERVCVEQLPRQREPGAAVNLVSFPASRDRVKGRCGAQTSASRGRHRRRAPDRPDRRPRRRRRDPGERGPAEDGGPLRQRRRHLLGLARAAPAVDRRLHARPRPERALPGEPPAVDRAPRADGQRRDLPALRERARPRPCAPPLGEGGHRRDHAARRPARPGRDRRLLARRPARGRARRLRLAVPRRPGRRDERLPEPAQPACRGGRQLQAAPPRRPVVLLAGQEDSAAGVHELLTRLRDDGFPRRARLRRGDQVEGLVPRRPLLGDADDPRGEAAVLGCGSTIWSPAPGPTTGSPAARQASAPPITSAASRKPICPSCAAARLED